MNENKDIANTPIAFAPITPARELWPEIEAQISPKRRVGRWLPIGVAASLALFMSVMLLDSGSMAPAVGSGGPTNTIATVPEADLEQVAKLMQVQQRADLAAVLGSGQGAALGEAMEGLLFAEQEIVDAINAGSNNPALIGMLAGVHRHQLAFIQQSMKV